MIRLEPGKTMKELSAWMQKPEGPPPAHGMGGIDAILPGTTAYFTADLTPGDYVLLCFVPDAKDGKGHYVHGMVKQFKVS